MGQTSAFREIATHAMDGILNFEVSVRHKLSYVVLVPH
jgi:hypothetical protein